MLNTRNIFIIPLLLFCIFFTSCSKPEDQKERHYLKALEYVKQEKPKEAIIELRNAIQIDAKYADARYQLGLLYLENNDPKNAFRQLVRAANLDHNNLDANLKAAEFYLLTRQKEESRELVERVLEKDPDHEDALALLANIELIEGRLDEALAALDTIGDRVNSSAKFLNIKGRIFAAQKDFGAAEETFRKAISVSDKNFVHYRTLLRLFQSTQEKEKASQLLYEMAKEFPENTQTHLLLAGMHRGNGEMEKVESELQKVIEIEPKNPRYRLMLADFYTTTRNKDKAIETLTTARASIDDDVDIRAALAELYFDKQDFLPAQKMVDEILEDEPGHGKALLLQARFDLKDNNTEEAIASLEKLTNDYPKWAEPFFYLALARYSQGKIDLAQYAISTAVKNDDKKSKYHTLLAQINLAMGSYTEARQEASTALQQNPRNMRAALIMAGAMIGNKEYEEAQSLLRRMNEQVPGNLEILGNLAVATLRSGEKEKGAALLEDILEISPGNNRAVMLLVELRYSDNMVGAENFIRQQIDKAPDNSGLRVLLGDVLLRQEKQEQALAAYEEALELNPNNTRAYTTSAKLLTSLGKDDEAMDRYQDMISQNPESLQGYMGIAALHESKGNNQKAMENYRKVLEIQPEFAPAANNLAWLISSNPDGDLGEALRLAMIAKKEYPDSSHIADTLGWVHYQRGSYTLAIPQFEQALAGRPDNPTIAYHLALALNADGQKAEAMATLEKLLNKNTEFAEREEATALLNELRGG